jgi:hypothetical protein
MSGSSNNQFNNNNQFSMAATGGALLSASSQTCQLCYAQNPACSNGGNNGAGVSIVAFSADSQGEADDFINVLMSEGMIADTNYVSAQVNRKYIQSGQITSDPSQVRVELITSDQKAQGVVQRVSTWKQSNGKSQGSYSNDAVMTPLVGGSSDYISFVLKQTHSTNGNTHSPHSMPLLMAQTDKK